MIDRIDATTNEVKACCAALYETEWARLLLGESFHPGGLALTDRLGRLLGLTPGMTVLDAACGRGDSALYLARTFGCRVIGIDFSAANVTAANDAAHDQDLDGLTEFRQGDVEALPLTDESVDAIVCECAFCTFPDKQQAAGEFARVLRPGGVVGLSDLTRSGELPSDLDGLLAWIACIADARPVHEYRSYLEVAGFQNIIAEAHSDVLTEMVSQIHTRLLGVELLVKLGKLDLPIADIERAKALGKAAREAIRAGTLGYILLTARILGTDL